MKDEPRWRRYLRFYGHRGVADLDDELRFHVDMRVRDYMARGLSEVDARAATADRLGDLVTARQACAAIATRSDRRVLRTQVIDALLQDARFALRSLNRQKAWTAVAVLTLALGIGANAAMFSVVNHVLLNPLPYPEGDRVVLVSQEPSTGAYAGSMSVSITPVGRVVSGWRAASRSFETLEPYRTNDVTIQRAGSVPQIVHTADVLPSFAAFAAQRPIAGRMFTDAEAKGEASVVVLSEEFWRTQFGGDESVLGTPLTVNEKPRIIVGVMPAAFRLPSTRASGVDLWLPLDLVRADDDGLFIVGRLRPGLTSMTAQRDLDAIAHGDPIHGTNNARFKAKVAGPTEDLEFQDSIVMLSVAVALVLLIACANVAHLLLARASTRQREMAIRAALGAGRERLFRQLLTESMLLSLAGCVGGLALGWAGLRVLIAARPASLAELSVARMDGMTLVVTIVLSVATGIAFGLVGAVQARRHSTHEHLKAGSLATSEGRTRGRTRRLLVVTEMALCTMLLVGATLLLRSVMHLQHRELGFDARGLYSLEVRLPEDRYSHRAAAATFLNDLSARLRIVSGVQGVTQASAPPLSMSFTIGALQIEGQPDPPSGTTSFLSYNGVDPNYFGLMGIRLVQGTTFTDTTTVAGQVIVNEGFARRHWPRQSAIGRKMRVVRGGQGDWRTVVGVAADVRTLGLAKDPGEPLIYLPGPGPFRPTILVRTDADAPMLSTIAGVASTIDPKLPRPTMHSIELGMQRSIAGERFTMFLLVIFAAVAVGLAAVGLYGVLAYTVAQRTREIGIRVALGASRGDVARSVMRQGLLLAVIGVFLGLVAARWGVKLVGSLLYGVQETDIVSFAGAAAILLAIAALACLVPARRAVSVDPLIAMKAD